MLGASPKQVIFGCLADIAQAIGHVHRLALLEHLSQGERSVENLTSVTGLSFANTSRHLQILRRAGLVEPRREGKRMLYSLSGGDDLVRLLHALGRVGEQNIALIKQVVAAYFGGRDDLEPLAREELLARMRAGGVTILDVRPEDEFRLGHLPGALNLPLAALERQLDTLPRDLEIVAYCRGPFCMFSVEAVAMLRTGGFRARRLEDGFPEWKAAGLPTKALSATG